MEILEQYFSEELDNKKPENLYQPISYILLQKGKRLRPKLVFTASEMFGGDLEQTKYIAAAFEMLHNFTLIHDDIMDNAEMRRGQPTVYRKWDTNIGILSGDALAAMAVQQILNLKCNPEKIIEISKIFAQTTIEICEGQQYDLDFETAENVSVDEYMTMIRLKTAVMFAGCLKAGACFANADEESLNALYDLGIHLGLAFQLADDLLDVYADEQTFGKNTGVDIKDNKKTYIYLKALELADEDRKNRLKNLFSTKASDENEKFAAVKEIYDFLGIKEMVEQKIAEFSKLCYEDIDKINTSEDKKAELRLLISTLQRRNK